MPIPKTPRQLVAFALVAGVVLYIVWHLVLGVLAALAWALTVAVVIVIVITVASMFGKIGKG